MSNDEKDQSVPQVGPTDLSATIERALGQLGLGIGIVRKNELTYANDALLGMLGYEPEELLGGNAAEIVNLQDSETHSERHLARLAGADVPTRYRVAVEHSSGKKIELEVSSVLTSSEPPSVLVVVRDITEQLDQERRLRQSHKMEAIGQLATGIAHDFNNHLTALRLTAEALEEWIDAPEPRELVEELAQLTVGAARLTRQLLAFGGRDVGQPAVLDVNVAIFETSTMLKRLIGEQVELVTRLQPGLPPVKADEGQLQQVIVNLVMNAREAIEGDGRIVVQTGTAAGDDSSVRLEVQDDGVGMEQSVVERAFEPYFTTKGEDHSGMGLSIVYGVVQHLHGTVELETTPGRGTTVTVDLPAEQAPFSSPVTDDDAPTLLLVEDEMTLRQLLTAGLRRHGYRVVAVADGDEAIDKIESETAISTLVLDVVIPGTPGAEVVEEFKARWPESVVVVISGYSDRLDPEAFGSGTDVRFLRKPFSALELVEAIRAAGES